MAALGNGAFSNILIEDYARAMGDAENDLFRLSELRNECVRYFVSLPVTDRQRIREMLIEKIETTMITVVETLQEQQIPFFSLVKRNAWSNVRFIDGVGVLLVENPAKIEMDMISKEKKFALVTYMLEKIHNLLLNDAFSTKRDIFYQNPALFGTQASVDTIIDDLACLYRVPRIELRVLATSKGLIAGNLHFTDAEDNLINCLETIAGISIPTNVGAIKVVQSRAKFILVVEKDATFQKLLDGKFQDFVCPCIIITGKGYPDLNTRELSRKLSVDLQLPVFGLADCDPHGIEILAIYKYGSMAVSYHNKTLTIPWLKWIGIHTSDITRLGLVNSTQPLNNRDVSKLNSLLTRPYIVDCPDWRYQMSLMQIRRQKAEIQILNEISADYLCRIFLPAKIRLGGWM